MKNHWKSKVFQGFSRIRFFFVLILPGMLFSSKMLPMVLFWCPRGPRRMPKGVPRGVLRDYFGWLGEIFGWDFGSLSKLVSFFFWNSCCKLIFHNILTEKMKKRPSGPSKPMEIIKKSEFFKDFQEFTFSLLWTSLGSFFSPKSFQWYCFDVPKVPRGYPKESQGASWAIMLDDCEIFLHKMRVPCASWAHLFLKCVLNIDLC